MTSERESEANQSVARIDELIVFRRALSSESDRGCALMAAAYLDESLRLLLVERFVDDSNTIERVTRPDGPIGTFSARADVAYLLGLISSQVRRDIDLIRKVRNDFGHSPSVVTFESQAIAARCRELQFHFHGAGARPRAQFTGAVLGVLGCIDAVRAKARRPNPAMSEWTPTDEDRRYVQGLTAAVGPELQRAQDPEDDA